MITEKPWEHDERCATCIFYFARADGEQGNGELPTGICKRYPPPTLRSVWVRRPWLQNLVWPCAAELTNTYSGPHMNDCDWCGEYVRGLNNLSNKGMSGAAKPRNAPCTGSFQDRKED